MTDQKFNLHLNKNEQEILELLKDYRGKGERIFQVVVTSYNTTEAKIFDGKTVDIIIITE
jgi:hypothetical protein